MDFRSIDIFCVCIDNFGDAGVAYRFARELKAARPECRVRLFVDDMKTLGAVAHGIDPSKSVQEYESVTCIDTSVLDKPRMEALGAADVMVEMFACHIPGVLMEMAYDRSKLIINLEYLSAEGWVEDYHLKESLLGRGSVRKFFFMPGFRETTGGLIINSALEKWRSGGGFDRRGALKDILGRAGVDVSRGDGSLGDGLLRDELLTGTVFTYERGFDTLITDIDALGRPAMLLVFGDKSQRGMTATLGRLGVRSERLSIRGRDGGPHQYQYKNIRLIFMPFIDQHDYDMLLCCTDFNIVRGEDSLARAILSGRPFIWNAYIQDDRYQLVKVRALLEMMRPFYGGDAGVDYVNAAGGDINTAGDGSLFASYSELMMSFNGAPAESPEQATSERYGLFLQNLEKIAHVSSAMYYFIVGNCNLIAGFCDFLDNY